MAQRRRASTASGTTGTSITNQKPIPPTISATSSKARRTGKKISAAATLTAPRKMISGKSRMPKRTPNTSLNGSSKSQNMRLLTSGRFDEFRRSQLIGRSARSHWRQVDHRLVGNGFIQALHNHRPTAGGSLQFGEPEHHTEPNEERQHEHRTGCQALQDAKDEGL